MSRRCLGDRLADLVDGRLGAKATARAYAHVGRCERCRSALAAQRASATRLTGSPMPFPSQDLLNRLGSIPVADQGGPDQGGPDQQSPGRPGWTHPSVAFPSQGSAGDRPSGRRPHGAAGVRPSAAVGSTRPGAPRSRGRVVLASAAGAAALAVAAVVGAGSGATGGTVVRPASIAPVVDLLTYEHAASSEQLPLSGPRIVTVSLLDPSPSAASSP